MANLSPSSALVRSILRAQQVVLIPTSIPVTYLVSQIFEFSTAELLRALLTLVPGYLLVFWLSSLTLIRRAARREIRVVPGEESGQRLQRLLLLPRRIEVLAAAVALGEVSVVLVLACALFHRSFWLLLPAFSVALAYSLLAGVWISFGVEAALRGEVLREFHAAPALRVSGRGFMWRRQSWFLGYLFALSGGAAVVTSLVVIARAVIDALPALIDSARGDRPAEGPIWTLISHAHGGVPFVLLIAFLLGLSILTARQMARYQQHATSALTEAIEGIARGDPQLPGWLSTDEMGDLAFALAGVYGLLKELGRELRDAGGALILSTDGLRQIAQAQIRAIGGHGAILTEALHSTAQLRQSSQATAAQATDMLTASSEAALLGRSGEQALERTTTELTAIRDQVSEMADKTRSLDVRVQEIATVTQVVKSLADQSNLLALNAAVEAVRAGDAGKGFAVVAREIRSLADQSIEATRRVREILEDLAQAAASTARLSGEGQARVESSLEQLRQSSSSLTQLLLVVRGSADAARQVAGTMDHQVGSLGDLGKSVQNLSELMRRTLTQLESMESAQRELTAVADRVRSLVVRYGLVEGRLD